MRTNDVYFQPGDKVMRVGSGTKHGKDQVVKTKRASPQFGKVYCIESFWEGPEFNVVMLVGFGGWAYDSINRPIGWQASAFRKVEEIKLCVAATKHSTEPVEAIQTTT